MPPTRTPILRPPAAPICRFTSMVNLNNRQELPDAPVMHIVDGKAVEPRDYNWLERIVRFLLRPFVEAWHHRDLITAILRRELSERLRARWPAGSGRSWRRFSLVTYTLVFGGSSTLPNQAQSASQSTTPCSSSAGWSRSTSSPRWRTAAPSLLHEYAHFIKQTMFPAEMLPIISTLRATVYA